MLKNTVVFLNLLPLFPSIKRQQREFSTTLTNADETKLEGPEFLNGSSSTVFWEEEAFLIKRNKENVF